MKRTIGLVLLGVVAVFAMVSCGGGGGGAGSSPPVGRFTSSDFAGKSVYYSDGVSYMLTVFASDGTFQYSDWYESGTPVINAQKYSWSISNGELILHDPVSGESTRNVLTSNNEVNRYYSVHQYYDDGSEFDAVIFYDQITGLAQAQEWVGNPGAVTPPSQSLQGTYSLIGFDVDYSNGTTVNENSPIVTSWSGTMKIGATSFSQSFVINGTPIAAAGSATISWITPNVEGIAHVTDASGTHDVAFLISGNSITTYSGVTESGTPGLTYEEWDYWTKVSDSLSPVRKSSVTEKSDEPAYIGKHWIGELLIQ